MMRFLADENFPMASVQMLSAAGHDVIAVALESPGVPDETVLDCAVQEERILLTFDSDYGTLIYRQDLQSPQGIIYLRFIPYSPEEPAEYLLSLLEQPGISTIGLLTVAERDRVRQKRLPRADLT